MKTYLAPKTLKEALDMYNSAKPGTVCWLAGGTDLKLTVHPDYDVIIDLKKIEDLVHILRTESSLTLGTLTSIQRIEESVELLKGYPAILDAVEKFGSLQIRERATVGGNICHGSPAADIGTVLLSLDAMLYWREAKGVFEESLEEYYKQDKEFRKQKYAGLILEKIVIPYSAASPQSAYLKMGQRKALDASLVSAAISLNVKNGMIKEARIALGAVAPSPIRAYRAEALLKNCTLDDRNVFVEAGRTAAGECSPITDIHAGAEYRKAMVEVLVTRGITQALERGGVS